jgi:hypothetical protein
MNALLIADWIEKGIFTQNISENLHTYAKQSVTFNHMKEFI